MGSFKGHFFKQMKKDSDSEQNLLKQLKSKYKVKECLVLLDWTSPFRLSFDKEDKENAEPQPFAMYSIETYIEITLDYMISLPTSPILREEGLTCDSFWKIMKALKVPINRHNLHEKEVKYIVKQTLEKALALKRAEKKKKWFFELKNIEVNCENHTQHKDISRSSSIFSSELEVPKEYYEESTYCENNYVNKYQQTEALQQDSPNHILGPCNKNLVSIEEMRDIDEVEVITIKSTSNESSNDGIIFNEIPIGPLHFSSRFVDSPSLKRSISERHSEFPIVCKRLKPKKLPIQTTEIAKTGEWYRKFPKLVRLPRWYKEKMQRIFINQKLRPYNLAFTKVLEQQFFERQQLLQLYKQERQMHAIDLQPSNVQEEFWDQFYEQSHNLQLDQQGLKQVWQTFLQRKRIRLLQWYNQQFSKKKNLFLPHFLKLVKGMQFRMQQRRVTKLQLQKRYYQIQQRQNAKLQLQKQNYQIHQSIIQQK